MVGICGTDVHMWREGALTDYFKLPMTLGHECSGVVSKIGEGVTRLKVGDRVCADPQRPCRNCEFCCKGRSNVCTNTPVFFAAPPHNGALAQYLIQDESDVYRIPDYVSFEEGALIEPLSVTVRACTRARLTVGDTVLICGAGTIGLCTLMVAKTCGASSILVTDVNHSRLEIAVQLGATHTLRVQSSESPEEVSKKIEQILGRAPDKAMECSGVESCVSVCMLVVKPCGVIGLVGIGDKYMNVPIQRIITKEIEVVGSVANSHSEFPIAIDMVASGKVNVKPLITHRYRLEDVTSALEAVRDGTGLKVVVECNPDYSS